MLGPEIKKKLSHVCRDMQYCRTIYACEGQFAIECLGEGVHCKHEQKGM